MKKRFLLLVLLGVVFTFSNVYSQSDVRFREFSDAEIQSMKETTAIIHTSFGDITLRFFPDVAPNHVHNFIELAKSDFYDGTLFHRVIPKFMIQGGDPNSKSVDRRTHGTGGPGYRINAEFNSKSHKRGILSMARSSDPNSAASQFFICVADSPWLDGKYTVFGEVVSGMDVADAIVSKNKDPQDNPLERIEMNVDILTPEISKEKDNPPPPKNDSQTN